MAADGLSDMIPDTVIAQPENHGDIVLTPGLEGQIDQGLAGVRSG
jgi:hypothetical protein